MKRYPIELGFKWIEPDVCLRIIDRKFANTGVFVNSIDFLKNTITLSNMYSADPKFCVTLELFFNDNGMMGAWSSEEIPDDSFILTRLEAQKVPLQ